MLRLGIDPGTANCGVAVLLGRKVVHAETVRLVGAEAASGRISLRTLHVLAGRLVGRVVASHGGASSFSHVQVEQQMPRRPRELAIEAGVLGAGAGLGIGVVRHVNARALKRKYDLPCEGHEANKRNAVTLVGGWFKNGSLEAVQCEDEFDDHIADAVLLALFE